MRLYGAAAAFALSASSAAAASCPSRSVLTTDCNGACLVCVKYSTNASPRALTFATADSSGCVVRCLPSSVDALHKILRFTVPSDDPPVEDIAALALPANITGLDLTSDATAAQTFNFPGNSFVANGTLLNFLGLHHISPDTLPTAVYDLPLATLRLQLNSSGFPAAVTRFKTINTLILDGSGFTTFPAAQVVGDMPQVRTLSLTTNAIAQVPVDDTTAPLYTASGLFELALGENKLTEFHVALPSLRVLDLHGNQLQTLPTSLPAMPALQHLRLDGNQLDATRLATQIPKMEPLVEMQTLNLSSCGLSSTIPKGFATVFPNLTHLDLSQNSLESIGNGDLREASLTFLNVSANKLKAFSGSFQRLETLDVSQNKLEALAATLPSSLTSLNASSNALVAVNASGLVNLEVLDLSHNNLTTFPASLVWDAARLTILRLSGNAGMASLNLTTDQFKKLEGLAELSVDATAFKGNACLSTWLLKSKHDVSVCVEPAPSSQPETLTPKPTSKTVQLTSPTNSRSAGIITTIVLTVGAIVFGIAAYFHSQRRRRRRQQQALNNLHTVHNSDSLPFNEAPTTSKRVTSHVEGRSKASSTSSSTSTANLWNDDKLVQLRLNMDSIRFFKVVGMGAFGQVWRGTCRTSSTESCHVAIKTLAPDLARHRDAVQRFVSQIKLQATLVHPRIVTIVGVAWNSPTDLCALLEFMPRGDLFATLHYSSSSSCSSTSTLFQTGVWGESKLQIALDIIDALSFLHAQAPVVLHRDLKSRNVLLDTHGRAKVSDMVATITETVGVTSPLWTAPEILSGNRAYDEAADVFSFGVILSELDTHDVPYGYDGSATTMLTSATKRKGRKDDQDAHQRTLLREIARGEIHPKFLPSCPSAIYDIAQKCLATNPLHRPSAVEVNFLLRRVERDGSDVRMSTALV